jgi:integrase
MLTGLVDSYLELRRSTGYQMKVQEYLLNSFAAFAGSRGEDHVRAATAVEWASHVPSEKQRANRLDTVRIFARYARAEDPGHEIPPTRVFAPPRGKYVPFLFTEGLVRELVVCASKLTPGEPNRAWTFSTLFSLLAVTGLRISEALALKLDDMTDDGLVIRQTKFHKSRLVPLHPTTVAGLARYLEHRGPAFDDHLFLSTKGTGIKYPTVVTWFLRLVRGMGIHPGPGHIGPRIHDLRHGFAVRVLEGSPNDKVVVDARMLALSTYLGHANLDSTYWYLHATPHLLAGVSNATEDLDQRRRSQ